MQTQTVQKLLPVNRQFGFVFFCLKQSYQSPYVLCCSDTIYLIYKSPDLLKAPILQPAARVQNLIWNKKCLFSFCFSKTSTQKSSLKIHRPSADVLFSSFLQHKLSGREAMCLASVHVNTKPPPKISKASICCLRTLSKHTISYSYVSSLSGPRKSQLKQPSRV